MVMFLTIKQEINLKYIIDFRVSTERKEVKQLIGSLLGLKEVVRYQQKTQL
jgi:hypothetical protein